jgi:tRNA1Val (adenine37-N6)-methyltransferase
MSNTYFRFRQFTINQDRCAMKVGTDGVLLGAWVTIESAKNILDIGTGTGLIALMLAQRSCAQIDAIEIDAEAATQAAENANSSDWRERINIICTSLQEYSLSGPGYDLIVTNPPYFSNSLPAPDWKRNLARHNHQLTFSELLAGIQRLLLPKGRFGIVLPTETFNNFLSLAILNRFHLVRRTLVQPSPAKQANRVLAEFSFLKEEIQTTDLVIEMYGRHKYSEEYIELTEAFYLNM